MLAATMSDDYDWLDLSDPRSTHTPATVTMPTATADINKAFDDIAALFEVYPEPPPPKKKCGKTSHLNTRKTKSK